MYGVGTRAALIVSAFGIILNISLVSNLVTQGLLPLKAGAIEAACEVIVLPIAMLAGAAIYENQERWRQPAE
jgi:hypothetical protein